MHICNGYSGMGASCGNAQTFVDAAGQLVRDRALLSQIKRRAQAHAASVDWQRVTDRFAALLLSSPQGSIAPEEKANSGILPRLDLIHQR
ncbi:MAG TPA: hypothetical protein VIB79_09815 [Candidatus Binatia bacterium]|jgi:hypothetical protein